LGRGVEVARPAEPAGVASVEIKSNVVVVQGFEGVDGALVVGIGRICTFLYSIQICDQVGKAIRFCSTC
jgi:hypothetical protein